MMMRALSGLGAPAGTEDPRRPAKPLLRSASAGDRSESWGAPETCFFQSSHSRPISGFVGRWPALVFR